MNISGSTFIVTGGSSGLGGGTVDLLASKGANIVILDVNEEAGNGKADGLGDNVIFQKTDVTSAEEVQAAIDTAVSKFGSIQGAINCAGIAIGERILGRKGVHRLESFAKVININLIGSFNVLRLAADAMSNNEPSDVGERGVVISTASVAAYDGQIGQAAYSASKGGIVGMTLPIARDLSSRGIRIMTVAPGIFDTAMLAGMPENVRESLGQQTPFPSRLGRPDEYAFMVQHIIENEMLNGEVIRLDGAIRLAPR
ncbi:MAG: 3-hydroxyacyl-CoA dehydrogenase [Chloroflexota bacterium]